MKILDFIRANWLQLLVMQLWGCAHVSQGLMLSYVASALSIRLTSGWKLSFSVQTGVRDMGDTGGFFNTTKEGSVEEKGQPLYLMPSNERGPSAVCLDVVFE